MSQEELAKKHRDLSEIRANHQSLQRELEEKTSLLQEIKQSEIDAIQEKEHSRTEANLLRVNLESMKQQLSKQQSEVNF